MVQYFYGHLVSRNGDTFYDGIHESPLQVRMHGVRSENIVKLKVEEVPEESDDTYYGWQRTGTDKFSMIFFERVRFRLCFAYGVEAAVESGSGKVVSLKIEPVEDNA